MNFNLVGGFIQPNLEIIKVVLRPSPPVFPLDHTDTVRCRSNGLDSEFSIGVVPFQVIAQRRDNPGSRISRTPRNRIWNIRTEAAGAKPDKAIGVDRYRRVILPIKCKGEPNGPSGIRYIISTPCC